jgi:hypothetical protein
MGNALAVTTPSSRDLRRLDTLIVLENDFGFGALPLALGSLILPRALEREELADIQGQNTPGIPFGR